MVSFAVEEEIVALSLIGRALRMPSQELRQRQGRQIDRFDVIGSSNESVGLMSVKDHNLASP
jgi:hypothetical protein